MDFREKLAKTFSFLRLPLMLGVVLIHCAIFDSGNLLVNNICRFFSVVLPAFCVPVFFIISGYFFFWGVNDLTFSIYKRKVSRRISTLVIPYILANSIVILGYACIHYFAPNLINPQNFNVLNFSFVDFLKAYWSIGGVPINYPLWFLRNLFVIVLLSPIISFMLKRSLIIRIVFLILLVLLIFIPEWNLSFLSGVVYFYIGGLLLQDDVFIFINKFNKRYIIFFLYLFTIVTAYFHFIDLGTIFFKMQRFAMSIVVIRFTYLLSNHIGNYQSSFSSFSFFLYLYHAFPASIIKKILFFIISPTDTLSYLLTYILLFSMTIVFCEFMYRVLSRFMPSFLSILTGGRSRT